jgi:H+/Cl- antiporter ClcA
MIAPVVGLGSVGLIAWTVAAKMVVYGVSLGAGFRGGPYFPVMFAGAGAGAVAAGLLGASVHVPATAGLLAATTYLAHVGWRATAIIGVVVGLLVGGPAMLPAALLGAAVGRVVPREGGESGG